MTKLPDIGPEAARAIRRDSGTWHEWEKAHKHCCAKRQPTSATLDYHENVELAAALRDPEDGKNRPILRDSDRAIADIGGGVGQAFRAWQHHGHDMTGRLCVVVDVDRDAIAAGSKAAPWIDFQHGSAEAIRFEDGTFDVVMSRVSLPYVNIPKVLRESRRVLKPNGRIWFTLISQQSMRANIKKPKWHPFYLYAMSNGYLLKWFNFVLPLPWRWSQYNSWQDPEAFVKMLGRLGFEAWVRTIGGQTVIEGAKR